MKRVWLLAVAAAFCLGCAAGQWDEALKDLRGDNMKMRAEREESNR